MNKYQSYAQAEDPQPEEADENCFGVNQRLAPDQLPAGLCPRGENIRMRNGRPLTRLGTTRPGWLNVTRAAVDAVVKGVGKFYGVGTFKDPNGTEWVLTAADGGVYRHKPHNGRQPVQLPSSVKILSDCSFCQAFNVVYLFRGKYLQPLLMTDLEEGFKDLVPRWDSATTYLGDNIITGQIAQEVAYGPFQGVSSLTSSGTTATCVTAAEHGYVTGADVVITGATPAAYNGRWNITVVDVNTFTFTFPGGTSPATGTIKVSNMSNYWKALGTVTALAAGEMTKSGTTVTVTHAAHGYTTGQYVLVAGADQPEYNGIHQITVTGVNTFTYPFAGSTVTPATGNITVRDTTVEPGQSPDTSGSSWQQIYNVLPNADDGIFVNNRLLVATSYTPGETDYDSTSTYTKKDFVVALDIGDPVHFDFVNEFRINQGGDDEIVQLVKTPSGAINAQGFATDAVIVLKGKSWGALTGVMGDLSQVALDMHMDGYGSCALRGGVVAGRNLLFPVSSRGICGLVQFQDGLARSVDIPFSNDVAEWVNRIQWTFGGKIRLAYWDDKLYAAVPLDNGALQIGSATFQNATFAGGSGGLVAEVQVEPGATYRYVLGNSTGLWTSYAVPPIGSGDGGPVPEVKSIPLGVTPDGTQIGPGRFVATQPTYYIFYPAEVATTFDVQKLAVGVNNAVLVYDFRTARVPTPADSPYIFQTGQWCSLDLGQSLCVKEWVKANYNGRERLFFIGEDGWANMVEESDAGDQLQDDDSLDGLRFEEVQLDWTSRGYRFGANGQKKYKWLELVMGIWNA